MRRSLPILKDLDAAAPHAGAVGARVDAQTLGRAQQAAARGDLDGACTLMATLTAELTSPLRASAALFAAGLSLQRGDAAAALALLQQVERSGHPVDEGTRHMLLAVSLRALGDATRAAAHAHAACAVSPTTARRLVLADAQKHSGALDEAVATLMALLSDEPGCVTAWGQLAGYHALRGDVVASNLSLAQFDICASDDADAARNRAFVALCHRDLEAALPHVQRALRLEPAQTRAWLADEEELRRFADDPRVRALMAAPDGSEPAG